MGQGGDVLSGISERQNWFAADKGDRRSVLTRALGGIIRAGERAGLVQEGN
jgi:hypothetical protein